MAAPSPMSATDTCCWTSPARRRWSSCGWARCTISRPSPITAIGRHAVRGPKSHPRAHPQGWRLHVERPNAAAIWQWLQRAASEWAKPPAVPAGGSAVPSSRRTTGRVMKSHYRVVIIGGGIVGSSILYHLSQARLDRRRADRARGADRRLDLARGGGLPRLNDDPNIAALQGYTISLYKRAREGERPERRHAHDRRRQPGRHARALGDG